VPEEELEETIKEDEITVDHMLDTLMEMKDKFDLV
jgi:hypothetical protein